MFNEHSRLLWEKRRVLSSRRWLCWRACCIPTRTLLLLVLLVLSVHGQTNEPVWPAPSAQQVVLAPIRG